MASELVIQPLLTADKPTIIFGFTDDTYSQCVYLRVDSDPLVVMKMADAIAQQFIDASAAAVKHHAEQKAARKARG